MVDKTWRYISNYAMEFKIKNILKITGFIISFIVAAGCTEKNMDLTNSTKIEIESEVHDAFNGLVEASKSFDSDRYLEYFDKEKFSGLNADGTVWHSMKDFEALIRHGFSMVEKSESLEFYNVKITVINQTTAILVNEYKDSVQLKNGELFQQAGGGIQVWSKSNGTWKLVSVSASDIPQITEN